MRIRKIAQHLEEYSNDVKVDIYDNTQDREVEPYSKTIPIKFTIEIEARSWGIKDLSVAVPPQILTIPVNVTIWDVNGNSHEEEKQIQLDTSKLSYSVNSGTRVVTLGDLTLYINADFSVDYSHSYLDIENL